MNRIFVVKIDGKTAAMTNNFDSAISYVEHLKRNGCRITIRMLLPQDVELDMHSMLREEHAAGALWPQAS